MTEKQKKFGKPKGHAHYLGIIKRILKASHVGWVTEGDKKSLRIKVGGKDFSLPLIGEEINHETYSHLISNLIGKIGEKEIKTEENNESAGEIQTTL